jgi:6-phosphofructokinase 1
MNAAIRAVARTAFGNGVKVIGVRRGFEGLLHADMEDLSARSVSDIMNRGGTVLRTARSSEMMTEKGLERAANVCRVMGIEALIIIGGDGSLAGGLDLSKLGINVIGIPATIDLDLACTEYTIGFDTAVNTGKEAINKIRDTSGSHERCSVVELMGRSCGQIALWCGITSGAEDILIPEKQHGPIEEHTQAVIRQIITNRSKGKRHNLIVVAEGCSGTVQLAKEIEKVTGIETRATILGYLQRGGSPTAVDVMHASLMGYHAVDAFLSGEKNRVIAYNSGKHLHLDLEEALSCKREYDDSLYKIMKVLAI